MASRVCNIEQLPTELLQSIFAHLDESNLLSLRLTCRTLSEAAFDGFATQYFRELACFLPDPARLSRLLEITSQPHLRDKVRMVRLTLDAFEGRLDEVAFAPPVDEDDSTKYNFEARQFSHEDYRLEQLDYCFASTPSVEPLRQLLAILNLTKCELHVELAGVPIRVEYCEKVESFAWEAINLIAKATIPIQQFRICPMGDHKGRSVGEAFPSAMTRHIRRFSFLLPWCRDLEGEYVPDGIPQAKIKRSMEEMCPALASMEHLEFLRISMWQVVLHEEVVQLTNKLLLANNSTRLRQLGLVMVRLPGFNSLLEVLSRCQNTLDRVWLINVAVYSGQNLWSAVFETLQVMPTLRRFEIDSLSYGVTKTKFFNVEEGCDCHPARFHVVECSATGINEVQAALTRFRTNGIRLGDESDVSVVLSMAMT